MGDTRAAVDDRRVPRPGAARPGARRRGRAAARELSAELDGARRPHHAGRSGAASAPARLAAPRPADEAEALAREAVLLADRTDFLNHQRGARADLAIVLQQAGRADEARAAAADALALYEAQGQRGRARGERARTLQRLFSGERVVPWFPGSTTRCT